MVASHRGPDGSGYWAPGCERARALEDLTRDAVAPSRVALGFSRLAILDPTPSGAQPMRVSGRATITYNGEIYNYIEIRDALARVGWEFRSTGDTEVLLKAYLQWGTDAFTRMDGMWALGLYDETSESLLLSRDRFGEKPLFWIAWRGGIAFASEIRQLARYPGFRPTLDPRRAAGFVVTGRPYDGHSTWFEGIHQLEPGHWMRIDREGLHHGTYHDLEREVAAVQPERSPMEWAARFGDLLASSVQRRLRSDVPVGTSLSSGVDSSAVLAEAVRGSQPGYRAFTIGSNVRAIDETPEAERFAVRMGATWHRVTADPSEFVATWDKMTLHQECPLPSTSLYGQWKVYEAARAAGVIVILDGQGADEILGGYHKFYAAMLLRGVRSNPIRMIGPIAGFLRHVGPLDMIRTAGYRYLGPFSGAPGPDRWLRPGLYDGDRAPRIRVSGLDARLEDIRRWSLPNLLAYADRNAMAHSVEARLPYLDPAVVAYSLAMPDEILIRDGWTKWPLRIALAARAGAEPAWSRGKRWFGIPQEQWLRGAIEPYVREWVDDPHPAWETFIEPAQIRRFQAHWTGRKPNYAWDDQVFKMVALDRFLRVWFPS